jgi:hypothetical protein
MLRCLLACLRIVPPALPLHRSTSARARGTDTWPAMAWILTWQRWSTRPSGARQHARFKRQIATFNIFSRQNVSVRTIGRVGGSCVRGRAERRAHQRHVRLCVCVCVCGSSCDARMVVPNKSIEQALPAVGATSASPETRTAYAHPHRTP